MTAHNCQIIMGLLPSPNISKVEKKDALEFYIKNPHLVKLNKNDLSNVIIYLSDMIDWDKPDWTEKEET